MFDVSLAHLPKVLAAKIMKRLLKDHINDKNTTRISIIWKCAIIAVISVWMSACNPESCEKSAYATVFSPYNPNQINNSKYVILRSQEEDNAYLKKRRERARLDINGKVINTSEFFDKIMERLNVHPRFAHLCYLPISKPWVYVIFEEST